MENVKQTTNGVELFGSSEEITNSIGMRFRLIPSGEFVMGSDADPGFPCPIPENPAHRVRLTRPFYLGVFPVTQAEYEAVGCKNSSTCRGERRPVETVCWDETQDFLAKLMDKEGDDRHWDFRLPTEAEWEYACRAGTTGDHYGPLDEIAWHSGNTPARWRFFGRKTHPVGEKAPNAFGLYDMLGNVWEWCDDWNVKDFYAESPLEDPKASKPRRRWFQASPLRIIRGGGCVGPQAYVRASVRCGAPEYEDDEHLGFRVVANPRKIALECEDL
jgi:formylglycine-generating enzyme required for sulfatase activity